MIYNIWIYSYPSLLTNQRLRIKLFILSYILFLTVYFTLINLVHEIITIPVYTIIGASTLWLPQILKNIIKDKIKHPPLLCYLFISINRILQPLYFRTNKNNMFYLTLNYNLIYILIFVLLLQHFVMIIQAKYGGRIIIPEFLSKRLCKVCSNAVYLSKKNIKDSFDDLVSIDCVICLNNLIDSNIFKEKIKYETIILKAKNKNKNNNELCGNSNDLNSSLNTSSNIEIIGTNSDIAKLNTSNNADDKVIDNVSDNNNNSIKSDGNSMISSPRIGKQQYLQQRNYHNQIRISNKKHVFFFIKNILYQVILYTRESLSILFLFYDYNKIKISYEKFPLIKTDCKHYFHSKCLNKWLANKSECPIDRTAIRL